MTQNLYVTGDRYVTDHIWIESKLEMLTKKKRKHRRLGKFFSFVFHSHFFFKSKETQRVNFYLQVYILLGNSEISFK